MRGPNKSPWEGNQPDQNDAGQRNSNGRGHAAHHKVVDRAVIHEGIPHVAGHEVADPAQILDVHRLIEAVLRLQRGNLVLRDKRAGGAQLIDVNVEIISRRKLNDDEYGDGQHHQQRNHDQKPLGNILEHWEPPLHDAAAQCRMKAHFVVERSRAPWGIRERPRAFPEKIGFDRPKAYSNQ